METFAEILLDRADDEHPGLLFEDQEYSWRDMVHEASRCAGLLGTLLDPGRPPHIGILLDNVPEFLHWIGGAALSGATVVGINPTRRGAAIAADIRHTDCQAVVTDSAGAALLAGLDLGPATGRLHLIDHAGYAAGLPDAPSGLPGTPGPHDRLLLLFTSGSTGKPKAVSCSQRRLAAIAAKAPLMNIDRDSVTYLAMPLFHGNSVMVNFAMAAGQGATIAMRRRFSASAFLPDICRYQATYFNYVGRALAYILAVPQTAAERDNPLRVAFGTEASPQDMRRFADRFGVRIIEGYGSSEGPISINKVPGSPDEALGLPRAGQNIIIADPDTGRECARAVFGGHGELLNAGDAIGEIVGVNAAKEFEGYYRDQEATAERVHGADYYSGDLGYRDDAGFFYFAGRSGDRLRVDSENFAAAPIERILLRFPGVTMCAVYAVPDPETGDQVMATLQLDGGGVFDPVAFAAFLGAQPDLGTKWAPVFVRITAQIPLTATTKVDKRPLREAGWLSADELWWRPSREPAYRRFTPSDVEELSRRFDAAGRGHQLAAMAQGASMQAAVADQD